MDAYRSVYSDRLLRAWRAHSERTGFPLPPPGFPVVDLRAADPRGVAVPAGIYGYCARWLQIKAADGEAENHKARDRVTA